MRKKILKLINKLKKRFFFRSYPKNYLITLENIHKQFSRNGPYKYLEIGVQRFISYKLSKASLNIGIDPVFKKSFYSFCKVNILIQDYSINFFKGREYEKLTNLWKSYTLPELYFIDGSHNYSDVINDIINCIQISTHETSLILIHDVLPRSYKDINRSYTSKNYVGDAYKLIKLFDKYSIEYYIIDDLPSGLMFLPIYSNRNKFQRYIKAIKNFKSEEVKYNYEEMKEKLIVDDKYIPGKLND